MRLGIEQGQAHVRSRTRLRAWELAQSPNPGTTITLVRLSKRGYESLPDNYKQISPHPKAIGFKKSPTRSANPVPLLGGIKVV